jgi:hypothetical protein
VDADLRAALPLASQALTVRVVEGLYVLALRHLAGGTSAVEAALATHNLIPLPAPGSFHGTDPWLLWTGPSESLLLTSKGALAVGVLQALAPGPRAHGLCAGSIGWLPRIRVARDGCCRCVVKPARRQRRAPAKRQSHARKVVDIAALVMRRDVDCVWLLVDRGHGHYTSQWIAHALRAAPLPM